MKAGCFMYTYLAALYLVVARLKTLPARVLESAQTPLLVHTAIALFCKTTEAL